MPIEVRYFAGLRERLGRSGDSIPSNQTLTVAEVWSRVANGLPLPPNTLVAVNMEYSAPGTAVKDGDEVAFFPPVTGG